MKRSSSWSWTSQAELDPAVDRSEVWIIPRRPAAERKAEQPLRIEVSVLECFNEALEQLEHFFANDSMLVAIVRTHATCHFLIYTGISEATAYDRCRDVRDAVRLASFGYTIATDPTWESLVGLEDDTLPAEGSPWVAGGAGGATNGE